MSFPAYHTVKDLERARSMWAERLDLARADGSGDAVRILGRLVDQADHEIAVRTRALP